MLWMAIQLSILMRQRQNDENSVRNFRRFFFFGMSSDVPALKSMFFQEILNFELE